MLSASVIVDVLFGFFGNKKGWQGFVVRNIAYFLLIVLSLVISLSKSVVNAYVLFFAVGFILMLVRDSFNGQIENSNGKDVCLNTLDGLAYMSLALGVMSIAEFSSLAMFGGIFVGASLGLLYWAINKNMPWTTIFLVFKYAMLGFVLGMGINAVLVSLHTVSAWIALSGTVLAVVGQLLVDIFHNKEKLNQIMNILLLVGYSVMVASIFFY